MLISSKAISYSKLFNKLCVRTQAFRNINIVVQGFSFLFWNNIKLIEMISVYFNTTLDGYYQVTVFIFFFSGKKIISSEVLLTRKAFTRGYFPSIRNF